MEVFRRLMDLSSGGIRAQALTRIPSTIDSGVNKYIISTVPVTIPLQMPILHKKLMNAVRNSYSDGEYFFDDIRKLLQTDSYARLMVDRYTMMVLAQGWKLNGENSTAVKYIERRFNEMERVGSLLMDEMLEVLTRDVIGFSNGFIVKVRDSNASSGKKYKDPINGELKLPLARLDYIDMRIATVKIWTDREANPISYEQYINKAFVREYWAREIIHFKLYPGKVWGYPLLSNCYDDIYMLRRLEDNMILQSFQHAIPVMLYQVSPAGNSTIIAQDNNVLQGQQELEAMKAHGGLVTTTDAKLTMPTPANILNMETYLNYAKARVLAGLHLSPLSAGEGGTSNKSTAAALIDDMITQAKYIQRVIARTFDRFIIDELLMESPNTKIRGAAGKVHLVFPEIDIAYLTSLNNHWMSLFNAGLLTRTETRLKIGMLPMKDAQIADTIFAINPKKTGDSKNQQNEPENQYGKKTTGAPGEAVNDNKKSIDALINDVIADINNSKLMEDEKKKLVDRFSKRSSIINGQRNDSINQFMSSNARSLANNMKNALNVFKNEDTLTIEQIISYDSSLKEL